MLDTDSGIVWTSFDTFNFKLYLTYLQKKSKEWKDLSADVFEGSFKLVRGVVNVVKNQFSNIEKLRRFVNIYHMG